MTTISSLSYDDLREIFLRLPNLAALVRAAVTCRPWLSAIRSSPNFRRLFRALHPPPLMGFYLDLDDATLSSFVPVRSDDPDHSAALRGGDFFLASLPANTSWTVADCRHGYVLLWNSTDEALAAVNPVARAVRSIPMPPPNIRPDGPGNFVFVSFHLISSDESPQSFHVLSLCQFCEPGEIFAEGEFWDDNRYQTRAAIFSSETGNWILGPWFELEVNRVIVAGWALVDGSMYLPCRGETRMIKVNTFTLDIRSVDLPAQVKSNNFKAGVTKDGQVCVSYVSYEDSVLYVWTSTVDDDGIDIWTPYNEIMLTDLIDRLAGVQGQDYHVELYVMHIQNDCLYLSARCRRRGGPLRRWVFSISMETMKTGLLIHGGYDGCAYPYFMAWPPSLVHDDEAHPM